MTVTGVLPTGGSWILELRSENHTLFLTTHALPRVDSGDRVFSTCLPTPCMCSTQKGNGLRKRTPC